MEEGRGLRCLLVQLCADAPQPLDSCTAFEAAMYSASLVDRARGVRLDDL